MKLLLLLLVFIVSCGDYSRRRTLLQAEEAPLGIDSFSTRLTNNFLVRGERCNGTEVVTNEEDTIVCEPHQYLVTVDNVNYCEPEGCTDVFVSPVIATLEPSGGDTLTNFYEIEPYLPDETTEDLLDDVYLQVRSNEAPLVVYRSIF